MILIALGSNLPSPRHGDPVRTCAAALRALGEAGVAVKRRSRWYRSAPVPRSDQPWFVNGVVQVDTELAPADLLALLHAIERSFGRERRVRDEARILDLDLLAYGGRVSAPGQRPALPHPRLDQRAFVVLPLAELAPEWRHPVTGLGPVEMAARLPPDQTAEPIE